MPPRIRLISILAVIAAALLLPSAAHAAPPPNDEMAGATVIDSLPVTIEQNVSQAERIADDPWTCTGSRTYYSVWFTLTAPDDMLLEIDTRGSNYDTQIDVYQGELGSTHHIACNSGYYSDDARLLLEAEEGKTYWIMVSSWRPYWAGNLILQVQEPAPPPNDSAAEAIAIDSVPSTTIGNNTGAMNPPGDPTPSCSPESIAHIWYSFSPQQDDVLILQANSPMDDTTMAVFQRTGEGDLVEVACNDWEGEFGYEEAAVTMAFYEGSEYLILLGGHPWRQVDFTWYSGLVYAMDFITLHISEFSHPGDGDANPDANDNVPLVIDDLPFSGSWHMTDASMSPDDPRPSCQYYDTGNTILLEYTPPADQFIRLGYGGGDVVSIWDGDEEVACFAGENLYYGTPRHTAVLEGGTRYTIILHGSLFYPEDDFMQVHIEERPFIIEGFRLVNAGTDEDIMVLEDFNYLSLSEIGTQRLNMRLDLNPAEGPASVKFYLADNVDWYDTSHWAYSTFDGWLLRQVEHHYPFAVAGDRNGDYHTVWVEPWTLIIVRAEVYPFRQTDGDPIETIRIDLYFVP